MHSGIKNAELARVEAKIEARVREYLLSKEFITALLKEPGSKSILEDIEGQLISALQGKKFISIHTNKPSTKSKYNLPKSPSSLHAHQLKLPKLRTVEGTFTSLTSIQRWINYALEKQIKDNMGTGSSKNILNFRTGRFAESAKVERISQSRTGMLTAFYSYMKYPYATFSEGGQQELPHSRDPKLLISKSIREIASTIVGNRMRAVSI